MGIFRSKPKKTEPPKNQNATISDRDRAVLELKRQRDRMRKYRSGIQTIIGKETQYARELLAKNDKQRAVFVLKKKRYQVRPIPLVRSAFEGTFTKPGFITAYLVRTATALLFKFTCASFSRCRSYHTVSWFPCTL